jgi:hypothetical protein
MTNRPKFLRFCADGVQLRVEQIGPDLWGGAMCDERLSTPRWERFTALTEDAAKHGAMATADFRLGPPAANADKNWRDLSDIAEQSWLEALQRLGFPGYPEREGMERWEGF